MTVSAGVLCLALGAVSGVALVFAIDTLTTPGMVMVAVTTTGFLAAGALLVARAHAHRPEKSAAGKARHRRRLSESPPTRRSRHP
ncbi:hypothetical protein [Rhodococcus koreensis]